MRVTGLARIPCAGVSVGEEGLVGQPLPADAIAAPGDTDLLGVVVVRAGVEHVEGVAFLHDGGAFHALAFPWVFGLQDGRVGELRPLVAVEIGVKGCGRDTLHLYFVSRIAGREVEQVAVAHGKDFRIDGAPAVPVARRPEDWVGGIAAEDDAVIGHGMADGIFSTIPVCLVEEMHLSADH